MKLHTLVFFTLACVAAAPSLSMEKNTFQDSVKDENTGNFLELALESMKRNDSRDDAFKTKKNIVMGYAMSDETEKKIAILSKKVRVPQKRSLTS